MTRSPRHSARKVQEGSDNDKTRARKQSFSPIVGSAAVTGAFLNPNFVAGYFADAIAVLTEVADKVKTGNLSELESMLSAQAIALSTVFTEMARHAALIMRENLPAAETYLRLALKAQAQCLATVQALAEIKNPRSMAFVKQANIAQGPQQVNNQIAPARASISEIRSNELLGAPDDKRLESEAAQASSCADPKLEAVGVFYGTENSEWEGN